MATTSFRPFDETVEADTKNLFRQLGHGGMKYIAQLLEISVSTIARGINELASLPDDPAQGRTRRPGAGRKKK